MVVNVALFTLPKLKALVSVNAPPRLTPAVLLILRPDIVLFAKVAAGMVCAEVPLNSTIPAVATKVPFCVKVPAICKVPLLVNVAPLAMVILPTA